MKVKGAELRFQQLLGRTRLAPSSSRPRSEQRHDCQIQESRTVNCLYVCAKETHSAPGRATDAHGPSFAADITQLGFSAGGGEFCLGGRVEAVPCGDSPGGEARQGGGDCVPPSILSE